MKLESGHKSIDLDMDPPPPLVTILLPAAAMSIKDYRISDLPSTHHTPLLPDSQSYLYLNTIRVSSYGNERVAGILSTNHVHLDMVYGRGKQIYILEFKIAIRILYPFLISILFYLSYVQITLHSSEQNETFMVV